MDKITQRKRSGAGATKELSQKALGRIYDMMVKEFRLLPRKRRARPFKDLDGMRQALQINVAIHRRRIRYLKKGREGKPCLECAELHRDVGVAISFSPEEVAEMLRCSTVAVHRAVARAWPSGTGGLRRGE